MPQPGDNLWPVVDDDDFPLDLPETKRPAPPPAQRLSWPTSEPPTEAKPTTPTADAPPPAGSPATPPPPSDPPAPTVESPGAAEPSPLANLGLPNDAPRPAAPTEHLPLPSAGPTGVAESPPPADLLPMDTPPSLARAEEPLAPPAPSEQPPTVESPTVAESHASADLLPPTDTSPLPASAGLPLAPPPAPIEQVPLPSVESPTVAESHASADLLSPMDSPPPLAPADDLPMSPTGAERSPQGRTEYLPLSPAAAQTDRAADLFTPMDTSPPPAPVEQVPLPSVESPTVTESHARAELLSPMDTPPPPAPADDLPMAPTGAQADRAAELFTPRDTPQTGLTERRPLPIQGSLTGAESSPPAAPLPRQGFSSSSAGQPPIESPTQFMPRPPVVPPTRNLPDPPSRVEPASWFEPRDLAEAPVRGQLEWPPPEPPRAAPERIGPEPPPLPPPVEPPPRKRRRRVALMVIAALVLLAGGGAGAVFAVPGLKAKLGLGQAEPEVVIQPPPGPVAFAPALRAPGAGTPAPTVAGVAAALAGQVSAPALGTLTGAVLDATTGETLWQQNAGAPQVPASTGKLLTAAAALLSLGHTEQLSTKVVAGKDPGTAIVVGGGDPTLSSLKVGADSVYPGAAHLSELVDQLKSQGIKTLHVDVSRYAGNPMEASWDAADVSAGHIAPITPVMLDGGRADATKAISARSGTPAKAMAEELANRLGAKLAPEVTATAPQGASQLGEVRSAPMVDLVATFLQRSDNVLAEVVAHEVARATGEEVSFAGASRATLKVLQQNGFDIAGLSMADASGLSAQDKVPAKLLASVLAVAAGPDGKDPRTAKLRPMLGGLPVAGGSGTLSDRYNNPGATIGRGWVRAKTGTLSVPPVNSLAGVVLDADGRLLVFAIITNGSVTATARPALDTIAATLRRCGCN